MTNNKLLNPSEVMNRLGISYSTLLRKIKSEEIASIKIGKQIRIPEKFINDLENKALENVKGGKV